MRPPSHPQNKVIFNLPQTAHEVAAQLNMRIEEAHVKMPKLAQHRGNVSIFSNDDKSVVGVRPAGLKPGERMAWSYAFNLDSGKIVDDTIEQNVLAMHWVDLSRRRANNVLETE